MTLIEDGMAAASAMLIANDMIVVRVTLIEDNTGEISVT